jgi:hypothetical protein
MFWVFKLSFVRDILAFLAWMKYIFDSLQGKEKGMSKE